MRKSGTHPKPTESTRPWQTSTIHRWNKPSSCPDFVNASKTHVAVANSRTRHSRNKAAQPLATEPIYLFAREDLRSRSGVDASSFALEIDPAAVSRIRAEGFRLQIFLTTSTGTVSKNNFFIPSSIPFTLTNGRLYG